MSDPTCYSYKGIKNLLLPLPTLPKQQRIIEQADALFLRIDKAIHLPMKI